MTAETVVLALVRATNQPPEADDVTAGAWGAVLFGALVLATVILIFSFLKQMRKADQAKAAGVYGDEPTNEGEPADGEEHPDRP